MAKKALILSGSPRKQGNSDLLCDELMRKAVIDRSVCRWTEVKNKKMYYIMTAADGERSAMDTTLACFRGYADCVKGAKKMGIIYGSGVYEKGEVKGKSVMQKAYEMGLNS